jgi:uncharacterized membrane protein
MDIFDILLILHFIGMAMAFSASFGMLVMNGLMNQAAPAERAVLGRFPPAIARVRDVGLLFLWVTGLWMLFGRWGGFGGLPWPFHAKITAVVLLSGLVGYSHMLARKARQGDAAAAARIRTVGFAAFVLGLVALIFAVATFR